MIEFIPETGSTNADLAARLRQGDRLAEGYWLIADCQSAGRGRQGRAWSDGAGNFMGSTVVRIGAGDPPATGLSFVAGLAVYEAVLARLPVAGRLRLKWPNDLLLDGRKLSGILLEAERDAVIIGIGVNLAETPLLRDRAAISCAEFGPLPDRDDFARDLAALLERELAAWRTTGQAALLERWQATAHPVGTPLSVHAPGGEQLSGSFDGLAQDGALQLRMVDGLVRVIHAGDVTLERN